VCSDRGAERAEYGPVSVVRDIETMSGAN